MALPVDAILEVKLGYVVNDQRCFNVLHYRPVGSTAGGTEQEIVASFLALNGGAGNGTFVGEFRDVMSDQVTLDEVTVQLIFPTRFALKREVFASTGALLEPVTAQNLQATITKRGDLGNRHNIGSIHIGGMPTDTYLAGRVVAGQIARLETLKTFLSQELGDGLTPAAYRPVILNKVPEDLPDGRVRYVISGTTDITEWEVQETLRTQRTRNVGRGI